MERRRAKMDRAFRNAMVKLQNLDIWFSNKANALANKYDSKDEVYINSLAKLEVMKEEVDSFLKKLKKGI